MRRDDVSSVVIPAFQEDMGSWCTGGHQYKRRAVTVTRTSQATATAQLREEEKIQHNSTRGGLFHSAAMKTPINIPSIFCAALALMAIFCSTGLCTRSGNGIPDSGKRVPPTKPPAPHYYTSYPTTRPLIKQLLDGTSAALFFLGHTNTTQVKTM